MRVREATGTPVKTRTCCTYIISLFYLTEVVDLLNYLSNSLITSGTFTRFEKRKKISLIEMENWAFVNILQQEGHKTPNYFI